VALSADRQILILTGTGCPPTGQLRHNPVGGTTPRTADRAHSPPGERLLAPEWAPPPPDGSLATPPPTRHDFPTESWRRVIARDVPADLGD
jgi:hypothetical protein